ncbi:MAG: hypothetical protein KF789_03415 [Bdellovibrionaceae bacterium]|nr:hypothetical protein [Pseudobdellovibrionaceae bacterium]
MKILKMILMTLLVVVSASAGAQPATVAQQLKKIDACLDQAFKQGQEKHGKKEFERILNLVDEKTNMFEDEEHCFNEKAGEDLKCQARVLSAAIKVLLPALQLQSLQTQGQACEGF